MAKAPHGWTKQGQERGAMVLSPHGPQARTLKIEQENAELKARLERLEQLMEAQADVEAS
jgi:hypothetical protein